MLPNREAFNGAQENFDKTCAPIVEIRRMANKRIYRGSQVERRKERLDFVFYLSNCQGSLR